MNWNRALIGIAAGVVLGLIAGSFVYTEFKKAAAVKPVVKSHVVVAATPLPLGTRLQPQHLRLIDWPAGESLPGMFTRVEDCVDRALMAAAVENEPILESRLAPREAGAGLPAIIPEGMRALSVPVNDVVAVAGFVVPGTTVDVLVTGSVEGHGGNTITRTILENIRVLAAGQKIEQDKDGKPQTVPVITLLVTPEEANKLAMASTQGKIQLSLRNTMDTKRADPPPVLQVNLFGGAPPPPAPRSTRARTQPGPAPPSPTFAVEVIRGNKREVNNFPNP